jgi:hypothetical protein
MAQDDKSQTDPKLEGEGSYTGTRKYNKGVAEHQKSADVDKLAEKAREAIDGEEGDELRQAEERGKRGPNAEKNETLRQSGERRRS